MLRHVHFGDHEEMPSACFLHLPPRIRSHTHYYCCRTAFLVKYYTFKPAMGAANEFNRKITDSNRRLEELRRILAQSRTDYDLAKLEYEKAQELLKDVGGFENPDGATAIRITQKNYRISFEQYRKALHHYSEFILGKSD
jgi:hypothetical protein